VQLNDISYTDVCHVRPVMAQLMEQPRAARGGEGTVHALNSTCVVLFMCQLEIELLVRDKIIIPLILEISSLSSKSPHL
jgi:hypothetical protein